MSILFIVGGCLFFFLRFYLFIFRERGREGEREKYQSVVASHVAPTGDLARNPGSALTGNRTGNPLVCSLHSIHRAMPARAGWLSCALYNVCPLDASSTLPQPPLVKTKDVSKHCQMSPEGQNHLQLITSRLEGIKMW